MKWCDCSHCIRRRFWDVGMPMVWFCMMAIGIVYVLAGDYIIGAAHFFINASVLWMLRFSKPRLYFENRTCKVELAVAMLKSEDDDLHDWLREAMTGRPVQPPPGKVLKCGTVLK